MRKKAFARFLMLGILCSFLLGACGKEAVETSDAKEQSSVLSTEEKSFENVQSMENTELPENTEALETASEYSDMETEEASEEKGVEITGNPEEFGTFYTTTKVNVRMAPSTEAEKYTILSAHTEIKKVADEGEWSLIYLDGRGYYVASEYLREKADGQNGLSLIHI